MDTSELYRSDFRYDKDLSQGDLGPTYGRVLERVLCAGRSAASSGCTPVGGFAPDSGGFTPGYASDAPPGRAAPEGQGILARGETPGSPAGQGGVTPGVSRSELGPKVLEIGCHTGYFSRVLRTHGCQVVGVEINAEAAGRAITDGFDVRVGSVEDPSLLADLPRDFDALLLMDVLEHLVDPWTALRRLRENLR